MITPDEIARRLNEYCDANNKSPQDLADATDVDRSQVYKILKGQFVDMSPNVRLLCKEANIEIDLPTNPADYPPFIEALSEVWDGSDKRGKALARVIKSLKGLS